ncbi:MAG TPA: biopolymer transporter ExbD [Anaeromyxobacteraceae bacterium]|nr:biopolymer transporter ExbD [Anaeromyxobacteraceae bacterium]
MGGAVAVEGGRGKRRRSLDASINVVPAIDLLSCCISFLLFTAVWTQISRLQVAQYGNGVPAVAQKASVTLTIRVTHTGHVVETSAGGTFPMPVLSGGDAPRYDFAQLATKLQELRTQYPDQSQVTVAADDNVVYADLVRTVDACVGAGLAAVSVTGSAG